MSFLLEGKDIENKTEQLAELIHEFTMRMREFGVRNVLIVGSNGGGIVGTLSQPTTPGDLAMLISQVNTVVDESLKVMYGEETLIKMVNDFEEQEQNENQESYERGA